MKERRTTNFYFPSCAKYGLDPTDQMILDWIYTFAFGGSMKSMRLYSGETGRTETFYWVSYEALITDYNGGLGRKGVLEVTSKSALAKRLKVLCDSRLLYFYQGSMKDEDGSIHKGNYTFYAINRPAYLELIGEKDEEVKKHPAAEDDCFTMPELSETGCTPSRQEGIASKAETNIIELEYNKATSPSVSLNEKTNDGDNSLGKSFGAALSGIEVKKILCAIKGFDLSLQDSGFASRLEAFLEQNGLRDGLSARSYVDFVWKEISSRKEIRNPGPYFAKCVASKTMLDLFLKKSSLQGNHPDIHKEIEANEALEEAAYDKAVKKDEGQKTEKHDYMTVSCPVCSTKHHISEICPECGLNDYHDEEEISRAKTIYSSWSREKRLGYYGEVNRLRLELGLTCNPLVLRNRIKSLFEEYESRREP